MIGAAEVNDGNYEIYKSDGRHGWTRAPGAGVKVAIDGNRELWVMLADGRVVQRTADNKDTLACQRLGR